MKIEARDTCESSPIDTEVVEQRLMTALRSCEDIMTSNERNALEPGTRAPEAQQQHQYCVWEKERRTLIGPWRPAKAALVRNYLEVYWPCSGGFSAANAIGTQLRDPMKSGLTPWSMAV